MPARTIDSATAREMLVRDLEDLIVALDRRLPQIDRLGERAIAKDAAALKRKAQDRLKQLTASAVQPPGGDTDVATRRE
jgi:hypothetical protein